MDCFSMGVAPSVALACLLLSATAGPAAARSAGDGVIGPVSRASVAISLSVAPRLEADRLAAAGTADRSGRNRGSDAFCIWSNTSIGTYSVSALAVPGEGGPSAGAAAAAPYAVEWSGGPAASSAPPADGTGLAGLRAQSSAGCGSGSALGNALVVSRTEVASSPTSRPAAVLLLVAPD